MLEGTQEIKKKKKRPSGKMEKQYVRYDGDSQIKNTEMGDRSRKRKSEVTWEAPRTLVERKDWGKSSGSRRMGEPVKGRTYSDKRRRGRDKRTCQDKLVAQKRRERERRREEVTVLEEKRNAREATKLYGGVGVKTDSSQGFASKVAGGGDQYQDRVVQSQMYTTQRTKVTRGIRQKKWGRGERQRLDGRGYRQVAERSLRTEVSQAGGQCYEKRGDGKGEN